MTPLTRWRLHSTGMTVLWVFVGGMFVVPMLLGVLVFVVALGRQGARDAGEWLPLLIGMPIEIVLIAALFWWMIRRVLRARHLSIARARTRIAEDDARVAREAASEDGAAL